MCKFAIITCRIQRDYHKNDHLADVIESILHLCKSNLFFVPYLLCSHIHSHPPERENHRFLPQVWMRLWNSDIVSSFRPLCSKRGNKIIVKAWQCMTMHHNVIWLSMTVHITDLTFVSRYKFQTECIS